MLRLSVRREESVSMPTSRDLSHDLAKPAPTPRRRRVVYPSRDGKPMAETFTHAMVMVEILTMLQHWFRSRGQPAYVCMNNFVYYEEGNPRKVLAPDLYVVLDRDPEPWRNSWMGWREGKLPELVFEITSRSTSQDDLGRKLEIYRDVWEVSEYFLFDPFEEYLTPAMQGYRRVRGQFRPIRPVRGRMSSRVLGLELERDGRMLRFVDPETGERILTDSESREAATREAEARQEAETFALREAEARREAESLVQREAEARIAAEARIRELEERLRQETAGGTLPKAPTPRRRRPRNGS